MVHEKISMGLDWYIKWFASIVLIFGAYTTAMNMYPYNCLLYTSPSPRD